MILPGTENLIDSLELDLLPEFATQVDFGIQPSKDPTEVFGALQWAYRRELTDKSELNDALGNGPKLTEIVNRRHTEYGSNPYACTIKTAWDNMPEEEEE